MPYNDAQVSGFAVVKKISKSMNEKKFFEEKSPSLFVKKRSSKQCAEICLVLMDLEIFSFW